MTKSSLYKLEVRLQKLEELTMESIHQMNQVTNLVASLSLNNHEASKQSSVPIDLLKRNNVRSSINTRLNQMRNITRLRSKTISHDDDISSELDINRRNKSETRTGPKNSIGNDEQLPTFHLSPKRFEEDKTSMYDIYDIIAGIGNEIMDEKIK